MKNGYVVYSEIMFDEYGLVIDKNNASGFPWVLKEDEFAPKNLFAKHEIRTLENMDLLNRYIEKLKTYELPVNVNYVCDINSDFNEGKFLGYDYLSRDMDYSPIYEAGLTDAYSQDFKEWTVNILNENLYIDTVKNLEIFIQKRNEILNTFCKENSILTDLVFNCKTKLNIEEFFKVKVYRILNI